MEKKYLKKNPPINEKMIEFLAERLITNGREIEGCLKCSDRNQCTEPISDEETMINNTISINGIWNNNDFIIFKKHFINDFFS